MYDSDFIDTISLMSFVIGLMNYDENLTQSDKQDLLEEFNQSMGNALKEIHEHLQKQDDKIDRIMDLIKND